MNTSFLDDEENPKNRYDEILKEIEVFFRKEL